MLVPWAVVTLIGGNYLRAIGFGYLGGGAAVPAIDPAKDHGGVHRNGADPDAVSAVYRISDRGCGWYADHSAAGNYCRQYERGGFFDTPKYSIRMLVRNINNFRRLDEAAIRELEDEEQEERRGK